MKTRDAMTADVIAVSPDESVQKAAQLMANHGISGLPVVDANGQLVGMISEGDLVMRQAARRSRPWWRAFFDDPDTLAREYQRATGRTVREAMTRAVVSVGPDVGVDAVSRILLDRGLRRLPVVEGGRLVGIISRGDIVKVLATTPAAPATASDKQLVETMRSHGRRAMGPGGLARRRPRWGHRAVGPGLDRHGALGARNDGARDPRMPGRGEPSRRAQRRALSLRAVSWRGLPMVVRLAAVSATMTRGIGRRNAMTC
jgi:CBS domain-containing protein